MPGSTTISGDLFETLDRDLRKIGVLRRSPVIAGGIRKSLNIAKRRLKEDLPLPGYPGDLADLKPLRETPATKIKDFPSGAIVGILGYKQPEGAHGTLLEEGHKTPGGFVAGRDYLDRAVEDTLPQQAALMRQSVRDALPRVTEGSI